LQVSFALFPSPHHIDSECCGELAAMSHNSKPRLSIGVPVRNGARFLQKTLDSLLTQSCSEFELMISDNASTDQTEAICRVYAARDRRIRYYRSSEDLGVAHNYNHLFQQARGEYFKWAAADDLYEPDYVGRCLDVLECDPTVVLAYAKARFIDETDSPIEMSDPGFDLRSEATRERLRYVIYASHWVNAIFGLIRAEALAKTRLLPSYPGGDYALLGELTLAGKFVEVPHSLFLRRLHPGASSQHTTDADWLVHFCTGSGRVCLPFWNRSYDHLMTIAHSGLSIGEKLSLVGCLGHRMLGERRRLLAELKGASAYAAGFIVGSNRHAR
jgi:glycosyltransferase involved in cell wall biosynthesis